MHSSSTMHLSPLLPSAACIRDFEEGHIRKQSVADLLHHHRCDGGRSLGSGSLLSEPPPPPPLPQQLPLHGVKTALTGAATASTTGIGVRGVLACCPLCGAAAPPATCPLCGTAVMHLGGGAEEKKAPGLHPDEDGSGGGAATILRPPPNNLAAAAAAAPVTTCAEAASPATTARISAGRAALAALAL